MSAALQTLLQHAERERDAALAALARAEAHASRLEQQATQLLDYRRDYRSRSPGTGGHSAPIDSVRTHQGFMGRLQDAMDQQLAQKDFAQTQVARLRQGLLPLELRVASVRKLLGRRAASLQQAQQRQDQRQSDETAQQQYRSSD